MKYAVIETVSYDGETIYDANITAGPFKTYEEALAVIAKRAKKEHEEFDEDNPSLTLYEGNGEIWNVLVLEIPE